PVASRLDRLGPPLDRTSHRGRLGVLEVLHTHAAADAVAAPVQIGSHSASSIAWAVVRPGDITEQPPSVGRHPHISAGTKNVATDFSQANQLTTDDTENT